MYKKNDLKNYFSLISYAMNVILIYEMKRRTLILILVVILLCLLLYSLYSLYWLWINRHKIKRRKQGGVYRKDSILTFKNVFGEKIETSKVVIFNGIKDEKKEKEEKEEYYYYYGTRLNQQIIKNFNILYENKNNHVSKILDNFKDDLIPYVCDNSKITILNNQLEFKINNSSTLSKLYYYYYIYTNHEDDLNEDVYDDIKDINFSEIFGIDMGFVSPYLYIPDNHDSFKYNLIKRMYDKYKEKNSHMLVTSKQ